MADSTDTKSDGLENHTANNDSPAQELPSELEKQIIRQIEYYFGDINLPRDRFLQEQIKLDDGYIPFEVLFKFKRLASLSTDPEIVIAALAKSPKKLMQVSEDKKKIRRDPDKKLPELDDKRREELKGRTVYVKGFPQTDITLDKILEFLTPYGPIDSIHMRTYRDKTNNSFPFKGSIFAIFQTKELAEKFLNEEEIKYNDSVLLRKWQEVYFAEKNKEREEKRKKSKGCNEVQVCPLPKGAILRLKGISPETGLHDLKDTLVEYGAEVAYVDFTKGDKEAIVRLQKENTAQGVIDKMKETKLIVNEVELEGAVVTGEEEDAYLEKARGHMKSAEERRLLNKSKKGRRGGHRGGRQDGNRGGRQDGNRGGRHDGRNRNRKDKSMLVHPSKVEMEVDSVSSTNDGETDRKRKLSGGEEEPPSKQVASESTKVESAPEKVDTA